MAHCEVDSFVNKFKYLCSAGYKATLTIEASSGEAVVTLKTSVGHIPPPCPIKKNHCRGPSYQRRQEKRQAARDAAAANTSQPAVQDGDTIAETSNVSVPVDIGNVKNTSESA